MKNRIISIFVALFIVIGIIYVSSAGNDNRSELIRKGDVDFSGEITAYDARQALLMSAGLLSKVSKEAEWAADIDSNNVVTSKDARSILRASASLEILPNLYYGHPASVLIVKELDSPQTPAKPNGGTSPIATSPSGNGNGNPTQYVEFPLPSVPAHAKTPGTFAFITYGYGHGVGMSQRGALYLATNWNYNYLWILGYYYRGLSLVSEITPECVIMPNGEFIDTEEILCRITQAEIGSVNGAIEAMKAQAVAAYTNIVAAGYKVWSMSYLTNGLSVTAATREAVKSVLGQYLTYGGRPASAVFSAMSAGVSANPGDVWGGSTASYPYLTPVASYFDRLAPEYVSVKIYTVDEIRALIEDFNKRVIAGYYGFLNKPIELSENPAEWFQILSHDGAVNDQIGYITSMRIGNQVISNRAGQLVRENIFNYNIRSHCFVVEYYG